MSRYDSTRRRFLRTGGLVGISSLAGCTETISSGENNVQDTDGDGMIDSEDYAPRDPDVQRASQVKQTETQSAQTTTSPPDGDVTEGPTDADFAYRFESDSVNDWSPIELNDNGPSESDNVWKVTSDAIAGDRSLYVQTEGDHFENIIATDEHILDMTRDFSLSFVWYTSDPSQRGPMLRAVKPGGTDLTHIPNAEIETEVFQKDTISVHFGADAISRNGSPYKSKFSFNGERPDRPSYAADVTHTVRIEKRGDNATLYVDDQEMISTSVHSSGQYRIALSASGTWGHTSNMTFDNIFLTYYS